MTFQEVISNLQNMRRGGKRSQDELIGDEQLGFNIDTYRAKLLAQEFEAGEVVPAIALQRLEVRLTKDKLMEDDIGADCRVYSADIPKIVETAWRPLLQGVRVRGLATSVSIVTPVSVRYKLKTPGVTRTMTMAFYQGTKLYVVTQEPLQGVIVEAVFERPMEVHKYKGLLNEYAPYDFEYPISGTMLSTLYDLLTTKELRLMLSTPNDITANGQEDKPSNAN